MRSVKAIDALRARFHGGLTLESAREQASLHPGVLASWDRSRRARVPLGSLKPVFQAAAEGGSLVEEIARECFESLGKTLAAGPSFLLVDQDCTIRVRHDLDPSLASLLDSVSCVPGHRFSESQVGTTAAIVALRESGHAWVHGPEHYHPMLSWLSETAAVLVDPFDADQRYVIVVAAHVEDASALMTPTVALLVDQVAAALAQAPGRDSHAVVDKFRAASRYPGQFVLASDGDFILANDLAMHQHSEETISALHKQLLGALATGEYGAQVLQLPGGEQMRILVEAVEFNGRLLGGILTSTDSWERSADLDPMRRQGSHAVPDSPRDYASEHRKRDLEAAAESAVRANRELLTPMIKARAELGRAVRTGRHMLLVGETGVGKRHLLLEQFRSAHPTGKVIHIDCTDLSRSPAYCCLSESDAISADHASRPHLLLLERLNSLNSVGARIIDEFLREALESANPPIIAGTIDAHTVDGSEPSALLLHHFQETVMVPALRFRVDEIADLAHGLLRKTAPRRSVRLSYQVIRVLEGYAWPGNVSELHDVLKHAIARKPVGQLHATDLPTACFLGRSRRLSMLENAQCEAIIQALYDSRGNRYQAAARLGIARSSLYRKIDAFGISYIA